jgi:hypothetical protein
MRKTEFTREELCELLWTEPAGKIAVVDPLCRTK